MVIFQFCHSFYVNYLAFYYTEQLPLSPLIYLFIYINMDSGIPYLLEEQDVLNSSRLSLPTIPRISHLS